MSVRLFTSEQRTPDQGTGSPGTSSLENPSLASKVEADIQTMSHWVNDLNSEASDTRETFVAPELSIVVPVYNELRTIVFVIEALEALDISKEIIVVDDGSTDGTQELLMEVRKRHPSVQVHLQPFNQGKGAALLAGFARCHGNVVIVQDADLEYSPKDIPNVIKPIQEGIYDVVYGSRYLDHARHRDGSWIHRAGNAFLTGLSNFFTGQKLTDMETAYKAFRRELIQSIDIEQKRFGFEPEITAKLSTRKITIGEVPIHYVPRSKSEGKKIGWKDLVSTLYCILRYRCRRSASQ